ncbi:hypothetical protein J6590_034032 [Homalodisca vitripennis]|nr:hypothetical protein J6590_034032 [Homalodisca vitripennis]
MNGIEDCVGVGERIYSIIIMNPFTLRSTVRTPSLTQLVPAGRPIAYGTAAGPAIRAL